jgi:MFS family permease
MNDFSSPRMANPSATRAPVAGEVATPLPGRHGPAWYRSLGGDRRNTFWAGYLGWGLDAFDFSTLPLALGAIMVAFHLTGGQAGLIITVTLIASAVGGVLAGLLADRIGRVRVLMLTIAMFSVFTALSGLAQNYEQMLACKILQGLGFGGEWATGAILIAEIAAPRYRGRLLGFIASAWAVGWALAVVAYTVIFSLVGADSWRYLFLLGAVPGLLLIFVRRKVKESTVFTETRKARGARGPNPLVQLFRRDLLRTTALALLVGVGAQGGYFAVFTWLPSYLRTVRGLTVVGTGAYLAVIIAGFFVGYVAAGYLHDWLGRRRTFVLFALCGIVCIVGYTLIPAGANGLLLVLGLPLGIAASGILSGTGVFFSELFPSRCRGAGVGLAHNCGRGIAAFFPVLVGALSSVLGLGAAIGLGAAGYLLVIIAVLLLPETRGKAITAAD